MSEQPDKAAEGQASAAAAGPPPVAIIMGSDSDLPQLEGALATLDALGVGYDARVISAHRTPEVLDGLLAGGGPYRVIIAAAGGAAHLAGAVAARTRVPVIGIPLASGPLGGFDALLATVQMPPGVPVATVSVGEWGGRNAAILACQILALSDTALAGRLVAERASMRDKVQAKDRALVAQVAARRLSD